MDNKMMGMTGIPKEWLKHSGTVEEHERAELQRKASASNLPLDKVIAKLGHAPFGDMTDHWRKFVALLEAEDQLCFFSTPPEMFGAKLGCAGYAIVRDGVVRSTFVTLQT